jgi:mannose-6-phosphate isomerase-like protein (cupin superfamily)
MRKILILALCSAGLALLAADAPPPVPGVEVVKLDDQPWSTSADNAVARQIVSPANSRARQVSIADIRIPAGVAVRTHYHKVIEEIYFVTGGSGIMTINGHDRRIGVGDAVVIRPGERHSVRNDTRADLRMIVTCTPAWTPDCLIFD